MTALTNLFTALANKIRSKTGGSATYTPPQMVAAIDDVYDAGVAAGETVHSQTYTPATNTSANDMGAKHSYRYVNTSGMITPTGNKSITANGTGIDVSSYATASVNVPNPTLSGDAAVSDVKSGKTFYNSDYTKRTGTFAADTTNNSATATTSAQTKSPDSGKYFSSFTINPQQHSDSYTPAADTSANDMGAVHNKRYVNTSGMVVPSGTYPYSGSITSNGSHTISGLRDYVAVTFTVDVSGSAETTTASFSNSATGTVTTKTQTFNAAKTGYTLIGAGLKQAQVYSTYINDTVCNWIASVSVSGNTITLTMKSNNTRSFACSAGMCKVTAFYVKD